MKETVSKIWHIIQLHLFMATILQIGAVVPVHSQYNLRPSITHFSRQAYKASEKNWAVDIDSLGYVYFGNNRGLLQFDGEQWKMFQLPGKTIIRSVKVGSEGRIYTGSFEEFGYWERNSFGILNYVSLSSDVADMMHNDEFWKIMIYEEKVIFQSFSNIFVWEDNTITKIEGSQLLFLQQANNQLYVQEVSKGLYQVQNKSLNFIKGSELFNDKLVRTILQYNNTEAIMCSAHDGIYMYDGIKFTYWNSEISEALKGADVNAGVVVNDKIFAIGTLLKGIFIFNKDGEVLRQINIEDELGSKSIYDLNVDGNGNFWVGMDKGISFIRFDTPVKLFIDKTQSMGLVYDICEYKQQLYLATNRGLYTSKIDQSFPESFNLSQMKPFDELSGQVWDLEILDDIVFCGHSNGTYILDGDKGTSISNINGAQKMRVFMHKNQKFIIQSTYSNLILYTRDKATSSWKASYTINGFQEPTKNIEVDEFGNIWVSHLQKGLYRLTLTDDLKEVKYSRYFNRDSGLPSDYNLNIFKVKKRIVITTGYGIYAYNNLKGKIVPFGLYNKQLNEFQNANSIFRVNENDYWFLMDEMAALYKITHDSIRKIKQVCFDFTDATLIEYYENIKPINQNYSVACLSNGLGVISNKQDENEKAYYQLAITSVEVFNKDNSSRLLPLNQSPNIVIQPSEARMTFQFTAFNYNEGTTVYKTRLLGIDRDWSLTKTPNRTFERLPQGQYTFEISMVTNDNSNMQNCSYAFTVLPPWYQTKVAYILYVILIISVVVAMRIYLVLKLKNRIEQIKHDQKAESENEQRLYHQRIIELENEKLQAEIEFKSQQLAAVAMTTINKNKILTGIKEIIEEQMKVLETRFPKKNYQEIIRAIDKYLTDDDWDTFEANFDRAHNDFFKRLKEKFPELTTGDIKICAYLKMNLSSKEIAHLQNISIRSIEVHRYRIRKKLRLNYSDNLVEYLMSF